MSKKTIVLGTLGGLFALSALMVMVANKHKKRLSPPSVHGNTTAKLPSTPPPLKATKRTESQEASTPPSVNPSVFVARSEIPKKPNLPMKDKRENGRQPMAVGNPPSFGEVANKPLSTPPERPPVEAETPSPIGKAYKPSVSETKGKAPSPPSVIWGGGYKVGCNGECVIYQGGYYFKGDYIPFRGSYRRVERISPKEIILSGGVRINVLRG